MKLRKRLGVLPLLALSIVVAGGAAAFAQRQMADAGGRPEVKVALSGVVERGEEKIELGKVESVQPGEILRWDITSLNEGTAEAREYKAIGHVPAGTSFVAGSAVAPSGSTVTYSIDGGKTFSTLPIIEERQSDGTVKKVPAPVSMYTEVRYEWSDALAAGGKLTASYKVRVK